ncbi:MAG: DEAD/DEAH box helicase [Ignavibacteriae bacterium]|nr:DEAD/DEAH box helicase [Ignavibacteriota bacterium]MCB9243673.1 DEAD/DEAH box helicase [Ignavibacteriales bacterium]
MYTVKFKELDLSKEIMKAVEDMGFEEATPIQSQSIPIIMQGKDIIGQAQTGTGKTASFGIPIIENIKNEKRIQALVLCPTRELTIQVAEEINELLKYKNGISIVPIYGGQSIDRQIKALKSGVQIIIATPGRLVDHIMRKTIKLDKVFMVVLDEADIMLDMGFRNDLETILKNVPKQRQTVLFSATMSKPILDLSKKYLVSPEMVKVVHKELTVPKIKQYYLEVKPNVKLEALTRLLDIHDPELAIVFCNTKRGVDKLAKHLQARGYFAEGLHGDMRQQQRDKVMSKFRTGELDILVATDVAARGIDVDEIDVVFNYDVPQDEEYYVHRIGRTARAGREGKAFTFVTGKEIYKIRDIEKFSKTKIVRQNIPSVKDVQAIKTTEIIEEIKEVIDGDEGIFKYREILEKLMQEDYTSAEIAAALLKILLEGESFEEQEIQSKPLAKNKTERLFVNIGKSKKVKPGDLVGAFSGESGIPGNAIGAIDIYDNFSFLEIEGKYLDTVLKKMNKVTFKGKKLFVEPAKRN